MELKASSIAAAEAELFALNMLALSPEGGRDPPDLGFGGNLPLGAETPMYRYKKC